LVRRRCVGAADRAAAAGSQTAVYGWRQRWRRGGEQARASKGPGGCAPGSVSTTRWYARSAWPPDFDPVADVTLQELRVELMYPLDEAAARFFRNAPERAPDLAA
jgi:hypothetical protein